MVLTWQRCDLPKFRVECSVSGEPGVMVNAAGGFVE